MHDVLLRDGRSVRIRALTSDDAAGVQAFVLALSPQARYSRFFNPVSIVTAERLSKTFRVKVQLEPPEK